MTVWRYEAIALPGAAAAADRRNAARGRTRGELAATTEPEARAALRRAGLQPLDLRPLRPRAALPGFLRPPSGFLRPFAEALDRRRRRLRRAERARILDGLGTMVRSGVPLTDAVATLAESRGSGSRAAVAFGRRRAAERAMLVGLRESLRGGSGLASAMAAQPGWFDPAEVAAVEAAQHGGTLPEALESLAERHEEAGRLAQRLAGALTYPALVAVAGVAVAMFLSVRTLPELARVLESAHVPVPAVTAWTMAAGRWLLRWGWLAALAVAAAPALALVAAAAARRLGFGVPALLPRLRDAATPEVVRTIAVSDACLRLAELVRCGVPVTEALRVLAPSVRPGLRLRLLEAASRVERGEDLAAALDDGRWFDPELRRLLEVAQASGELDRMLERVGRSRQRDARRRIDRLASLMEPAVIVLLAALVGTVVMAAVLPLVRMKDII